MQKCIIFIDGSNFYFKLRDLGLDNLLEFDFAKFANNLASRNCLVKAVYYVGAIKIARQKGKLVEYVGFSHRPSMIIKTNCDSYRFFSKESLLPFITSI